MFGEVFKLFGTVGLKADEAEKGLDNIANKAKNTGTGMMSAFKAGIAGAAKLATSLGIVLLAKKGFEMLTSSIGAATKRIDAFEQFERVMTVMTGSTEKAKAALDKTNTIVKGTAYGLDVAAGSVQKFVTSNMDVDKATDTVAAWGDAVAFYGDGSNETFATVTDAIAKMSAKGKVDMGEMNRLTDARIPALQIFADATGKSMEQVTKDISAGKVSTEEFTDVMNDALMNGTDAFAGIQGAAKDAGASWGASMDNMAAAIARGTASVITETDRMLKENGLPTMREMIGKFGSAFESALTKASTYVGPVINALANLYRKVQESTIFNTLKEVIRETVDRIKEFFSTLQESEAFNRFKDAAKEVAQAILDIDLTKVITAVGEFLDKWSPLIVAIAAGVAAFKLIMGIMSIVTVITHVVTGIQLAISVFGGLSGAAAVMIPILTGVSWPIIAIVAAITAVVAAGVALWKNWDTISAKATEIFNGLKEFFSATWQSITNAAIRDWNSFMEWITGMWTAVIDGAKAIFSGLGQFFSETWQGVKDQATALWNGIKDFLSGIWNGIVTMASAVWSGLATAIGWIMDDIKQKISFAWEFIKTTILVIIGIIGTIVMAGWALIGDHVMAALNFIKGIITTVWDFIKTKIQAVIEVIKTVVGTAWEYIKQVTTTVFNSVKAVIMTIWNAIKTNITMVLTQVKTVLTNTWNAIKTVTTTVFNAIKSVITSIWNAIKSVITTVMNSIKSTVNSVWNAIKSVVTSVVNAIKSVVTSVWNAIRGTTSSVFNSIRSTISSVINSVRSTISSVLNSIKSTFSSIFNSLSSTVTSAFSRVRSAVSSGISGALSVITGFISRFRTAGSNIVGSIADGITGGIKKVTGAISNVVQKARDYLPFSPAKTGPLKDLDKLNFGGTIGGAIEDGKKKVQRKLKDMLQVPDIGETEMDLSVNARNNAGGSFATASNTNTQRSSGKEATSAMAAQVRELGEAVRRLAQQPVYVQIDGRNVAIATRDPIDEQLGYKERDRNYGKGRR